MYCNVNEGYVLFEGIENVSLRQISISLIGIQIFDPMLFFPDLSESQCSIILYEFILFYLFI